MGLSSIHFEALTSAHKELVFSWLDESHVQEFWDNSPEHRTDIEIFTKGRVEYSPYFDGIFSYWVGFMDKTPYSLIMTSEYKNTSDTPDYVKPHLSTTGKTFGIDFCIGNKDLLGKGKASITLEEFVSFFAKEIESQADTFFIDPDINNPKATHVYLKAGFKPKCNFENTTGFFVGNTSSLMVKTI